MPYPSVHGGSGFAFRHNNNAREIERFIKDAMSVTYVHHCYGDLYAPGQLEADLKAYMQWRLENGHED